MIQVRVSGQEAGQRLDKLLHKILCEAPGSFLYKMLRKKNITLNEKKAEGKERVKEGDLLTFFLSDETFQKFAPGYAAALRGDDGAEKISGYRRAYQDIGSLEIAYEDAHVLIVDKPPGLLTQKAESGDLSLNEWLIGYLLAEGRLSPETLRTFKPSVCNRLDRNTGGLVICGCTLAGSQRMGALLKDRTLHKYYRLVVRGAVEEGGRLEGYLNKSAAANRVTVLTEEEYGALPPGEREAYSRICTSYEPIRTNGSVTLLEAELITGRTHQIRAHFAGIGHPLIGDYKYGSRTLNDSFRRQFGIESQLLYACRLEFPLLEAPFGGLSQRSVEVCMPEVFARVLERID